MKDIGYYSLLKQIKTRVEHVNIENTLSRRRLASAKTGTPQSRQRTGPTATYACKQWQPELPTGESDAVHEEKRQILENMSQRYSKSGAERSDVSTLMKDTYYFQRKHINDAEALPVTVLKRKWPHLFVQKFLCAHFEELTGINIHQKLKQAMQECGRVDFFKSKPTNDCVKRILSTEEHKIEPYVIQLLLAHFRENQDGLLIIADLSISHTKLI
ncbi:hypothetical protein EXN66_Car018190 [Channa argus]|uniref:Uncharacterized protein n=1 Tax=Channa argus TaxID=215402 RepID=A0A6G1QIX6_CHAAH|nr:hypothetical protein EXN66_Car018190 [Channa argus]